MSVHSSANDKDKFGPEVQHLENGGEAPGDVTLAGGSLGTLQLQVGGQVVLIPTPSSDPNDPLNWSSPFKLYITGLACMAVFMADFGSAAATVAIFQMAVDFTGFLPNIAETAYFFSVSFLFLGSGMFVWNPLLTKFGKRPIYILSFLFFFLATVWSALAETYATQMASRVFIGFFGGAAECLAPLSITDLYFVHERGTYLGVFQAFLSCGVAAGIVIGGLVVNGTHEWRDISWVGAALIGAVGVLMLLSFPETSYRRLTIDRGHMFAHDHYQHRKDLRQAAPASFIKRLSLYNGTFTKEPLWKIFVRPFFLPILPAVLWATLVFASTIGFLVGISSNFAVALAAPPYNFTTLQSSLTFIGGLVGSLLGIPAGGHMGDWIAMRATRRNDGIREPEHRLPAIYPHIVIAPLSLILYGVGIQHGLHWICPTIGLSLLSFTIVAATNHAMAYVVECYKPIASEVVVSILGYKAIIGFGLSFGTNLWIENQGYQNSFGEQAAISGFFMLLSVPFTIYGGAIRQASFEWRVMRWVKWADDRDDLQVVIH